MFPFSLLPLLPQESILKELDPIDMFYFSLISRKSYFLAKHSKLEVKQVGWCLGENQTYIDVKKDGHCDKRNFSVMFESEPESSETLKFHARIGDINFGVYARMHKFGHNMLTIVSEDAQVLAEVISNRIMDVLNPEKFHLNIEDSSIRPYIFKHTRTFEEVLAELSDNTLHATALQLFNDTNTNNLHLMCSALKIGKNPPPLNHKKLRLVEAPWFTKDLLMSQECEELHVEDPNLTSEDFQEFFDAWKKGKYPKLKELHIEMERGFQWNLNLARVDEDGEQVIKDVGGKLGKLTIQGIYLDFVVKF